MATQSRLPAFLLTRPAAQSHRFAAQLHQRFGQDIAITISPLLAPAFLGAPFPQGSFAALIFTSETGVAAFLANSARPASLPKLAYCVGARTANAARNAGLESVSADADAASLVALIRQHGQRGPLLHICGRHTRGDIAQSLTDAGIPTQSCVLYDQIAQDLTKDAIAVLRGEQAAMVPLFSPRSAAVFGSQVLALSLSSQPTYAVLSKAVGDSLSEVKNAKLCYADKPTAASLIDAIAKFYAAA
ncbi:uroporphyrinogen-III synthase [Pseudorhodobacter sp. W20_MBD10_FR17]|uniref:uroporphyrinogen-III synthase n=1 Tax=Pseudorhodobacter sp. W20_MBD10_FR17 TaxID=3240266 RepID=UPI003F969B87